MTEPRAAEVVVRRVLDATPDVVFDEWVDADALAEWMCPRPARTTAITLDARIGGAFRFDVTDDGTELVITGRYLELERPRRLQFSWSCTAWSDPRIESVVTVTLDGYGNGQTLMTITHVLLPPDQAAGHEGGWARIAMQLADRLPR